MIKSNEKQVQQEKEIEELPDLEGNDLIKILWMFLRTSGMNIAAKKAELDSVPEKAMVNVIKDNVNRQYVLTVPRKRKRGIIKPNRKLILTGN